MPQFYVRFDGEVWCYNHRISYEMITACVIQANTIKSARKKAKSMIPGVVKMYPFPFMKEEDGGVPIEADEVSATVMPAEMHINNLIGRAQDIINNMSSTNRQKGPNHEQRED